MRHRLRYVTHDNLRSIDFTEGAYRYDEHSFLSHMWSFQTAEQSFYGSRIISRRMDEARNKLPITVFARNDTEYYAALENLRAIFDYDNVRGKLGTIWFNDWCLDCNLFQHKTGSQRGATYTKVDVDLLCPDQRWYKKTSFDWTGYNAAINPLSGSKKYAYKYPYKYAGAGAMLIGLDGDLPADLIIEFFGPCSSPSVFVGAKQYTVYASASAGESIVIDGQKREVYKKIATGDRINLFEYRGPGVFEPLMGGNYFLTRDAGYPVKITSVTYRTEPLQVVV